MRPGQLEPNEFEIAILDRLAQDVSAIGPLIAKLHVLSRELQVSVAIQTSIVQKRQLF